MVCRDFILPEPASYVFFYALSNLRNLLYIILKLSDEIGVKKAAQQLGIAYYTLADWRSIRRNTPPAKTLSAEEQSIRIRELEREVSELRTANDILKDALGFFVKDRKR